MALFGLFWPFLAFYTFLIFPDLFELNNTDMDIIKVLKICSQLKSMQKGASWIAPVGLLVDVEAVF